MCINYDPVSREVLEEYFGVMPPPVNAFGGWEHIKQ